MVTLPSCEQVRTWLLVERPVADWPLPAGKSDGVTRPPLQQTKNPPAWRGGAEPSVSTTFFVGKFGQETRKLRFFFQNEFSNNSLDCLGSLASSRLDISFASILWLNELSWKNGCCMHMQKQWVHHLGICSLRRTNGMYNCLPFSPKHVFMMLWGIIHVLCKSWMWKPLKTLICFHVFVPLLFFHMWLATCLEKQNTPKDCHSERLADEKFSIQQACHSLYAPSCRFFS